MPCLEIYLTAYYVCVCIFLHVHIIIDKNTYEYSHGAFVIDLQNRIIL